MTNVHVRPCPNHPDPRTVKAIACRTCGAQKNAGEELRYVDDGDDPLAGFRLLLHRPTSDVVEAIVQSLAEPSVSLASLDTVDCDYDQDDRRETRERARTVVSILERCSEELARLELVPTSDAEDVNTLSASKGFVARARNLLKGRFQ